MPRSLANACHSFINTLVYIWTLVLQTFSHPWSTPRPPRPPPDQLTPTPYPTPGELDLENGLGRVQDIGLPEGHRGICATDAESMAYVNAVRNAIMEDARRQKSLRRSSAFSPPRRTIKELDTDPPMPVGNGETITGNANGSATRGMEQAKPLPPAPSPDKVATSESADISSAYSHNTPASSPTSTSPPPTSALPSTPNPTPTLAATATTTSAPTPATAHSDPFTVSPNPSPIPSPSVLNAFRFGGACFPYPLSSTPPRTPKNKRGHRRAPLATITNLTHVAGPFSPPSPSPPAFSPTAHRSFTATIATNADLANASSSPANAKVSSNAGTITRPRSQSLRRKPAFEDLHTPSPTRRYSGVPLRGQGSPSPKSGTRPVSIVWFADKHGIPFKSVSPLRIVKRCLHAQPLMQTQAEAQSDASSHLQGQEGQVGVVAEENLRDMVAAVRNLREAERDEEGDEARELINRASVWTCKTAATVESGRHFRGTLEGEENDTDDTDGTDEEEYGDQATCRSTCSPPPPYAFANPAFFYRNSGDGVEVEEKVLNELDEGSDTPRGPRVKSMSICGPPASESTELSYLRDSPGSPVSSMGSSLEDILTSFEGLLSTLGPATPAGLKTPTPKMPTHLEMKVERERGEGEGERGISYQLCPYGGIAGVDVGEGVEMGVSVGVRQGGERGHWSEVMFLEGYAA